MCQVPGTTSIWWRLRLVIALIHFLEWRGHYRLPWPLVEVCVAMSEPLISQQHTKPTIVSEGHVCNIAADAGCIVVCCDNWACNDALLHHTNRVLLTNHHRYCVWYLAHFDQYTNDRNRPNLPHNGLGMSPTRQPSIVKCWIVLWRVSTVFE